MQRDDGGQPHDPRGSRSFDNNNPLAEKPSLRGGVEIEHQLGYTPVPATNAPQAAYLLLDITVHEIAQDLQMPLNICLVLDQSMSMRGDKFANVREAARHLVRQMAPSDVISMVTFNDRATVVCTPRHVEHRAQISSLLDDVVPRGGTELAAGMEWGISQLHDGLKLTGPAISWMLLLTDGRTYGDESVCVELADYARKQGFILTSLGVGEEWNEDLLESLAARTGSRSEYIARPDAIVTAFREHFERMRRIVGYNARMSFVSSPGAKVNQAHRVRPAVGPIDPLLAAEPNEQLFDLGTMVSGEGQSILVELVLPALALGEHKILDATLSYQQAAVGRSRVKLPYQIGVLVAPPSLAAPSLSSDVKSAAEKVIAFRLQSKAWQDLEDGNLVGASQKLEMVATRLLEAGEIKLADQVFAEIAHLEQHGRASQVGPKQIKYGTRGLGRTQGVAGTRPATSPARSS